MFYDSGTRSIRDAFMAGRLPLPSLFLDFMSEEEVLNSLLTFSRASLVTYHDKNRGVSYGPHNYAANNTNVGAAAGTPGTLPTGTSATTSGTVTRQIVGAGTENGIPYLEVAITLAVSSYFSFFLHGNTTAAAIIGQTWSAGVYVSLVSGALPAGSGSASYLAICERNAAATYLNQTTSALTPTGAALNTQPFTAQRTMAEATCAYTQSYISFITGSGAGATFTVRIGGAQFNRGATLSRWLPTGGSAYFGPAFDRYAQNGQMRGIREEEQRSNLLAFSERVGGTGWTSGAVTATIGAASAPNGETQATKLTPTAVGGAHEYWQAHSVTSGTRYTHSAYFKAAGYRFVVVRPYGAGLIYSAVVDLERGVQVSGDKRVRVARLASGWVRVEWSFVATSTGTGYWDILIADNTAATSFAGDGTSGILVWGAQAEAGPTASSMIVTGATAGVTRAADTLTINTLGPWFNANEGTIYIEAENYDPPLSGVTNHNLVGFDNGTVNQYILLRMDNSGNNRMLSQIYSNPAIANVYGTLANFRDTRFNTALSYTQTATAVAEDGIDYQSGAVSTFPTGLNRMVIMQGSGQMMQRGWIRRILYWPQALSREQMLALTTNLDRMRAFMDMDFLNDDNAASSIGCVRNGTATRITAAGLIEAVGVHTPRFDHYPLGGRRGLMCEPQRTNMNGNSGDLSAAGWTNEGTLTVTGAAAPAPDGTTSATLLTAVAGNNDRHQRYYSGTATATIGVVYALSVWVRASTTQYVAFGDSGDTLWREANFTLSGDGVVNTTANITSAKIVRYPNGWYRLTIVYTRAGAGNVRLVVKGVPNTTTMPQNSFLTSATPEAIYVWGAQSEAGAWETSYIPTAGSALTRGLDDLTCTDFALLANAVEGVLEVAAETPAAGQYLELVNINDGTNNNGHGTYVLYTNNRAYGGSVVGGATQASMSTADNAVSREVPFRISYAYKANDFYGAKDGTAFPNGNPDVSGSVAPDLSRCILGYNIGNNRQGVWFRQLRGYRFKPVNDNVRAMSA